MKSFCRRLRSWRNRAVTPPERIALPIRHNGVSCARINVLML
jgi:hypothetical protein